jgi:hypothetical protein
MVLVGAAVGGGVCGVYVLFSAYDHVADDSDPPCLYTSHHL